jgi:hypothetical protein
MRTNQTAELKSAADFPIAEQIAEVVLEKSPGLTAKVNRPPADDGAPQFTSIIFSVDGGPGTVPWEVHQEVVRVALETAGVTDRFKPLL